MAQSMSQELRDPPTPATIMRMASLDDSCWNRDDIGSDMQHSGQSISHLSKRSHAKAAETTPVEAITEPSEGMAVGSSKLAQQSQQSWRAHLLSCGRCVTFKEAPRYLRREFILSGYYVGGSHVASVWWTLLGLNNETLNAWTMLGGVAVCMTAWHIGRQKSPEHNAAFLMMALSCLPHAPFSILLHATIGVSEKTRDMLRTLDVFFILTCGVPRGLAMAWFVFQGRLKFWAYAAVIGVNWGWSVMSTCIARRIKDIPKAQLARDVTGAVLCYLTPVAYSAASEVLQLGRHGLDSLLLALVLALLYVAAWFYSRHLPERWHPGAYDLIGNSHQIMHSLVVLEYLLEWVFLLYKASQQTRG